MRQQLDVGIAHVPDIGDQLRRKLLIAEIAAVFMALPRAGVDLVDVDRAGDGGLLRRARAVGRVVPAELRRRADDARRLRQGAAAPAIGIGLIDRAAGAAGHAVFIGLSGLRIDGDRLPHARADRLHRQILGVPEVELAHDVYSLCIGRPDAEDDSLPRLPSGSRDTGRRPVPVPTGTVSKTK